MNQANDPHDEKVIAQGGAAVEKDIPPFLLPGWVPPQPQPTTVPLSEIEFHERTRDNLRAESMVNLAVGVTLLRMDAYEITITEKHLEEFNKHYRVTSTLVDGGFKIEVTAK